MTISYRIIHLTIATLLLGWVFTQDPDPRQCQIEPADYEFSLNVIASVIINGEPSIGEQNMLGAYIDGECRGQATPLDFQGTDLYFLVVYSNSNSGNVGFSYYTSQLDTSILLDQNIDFQPNLILGTVVDPFVLTGTDIIIGDLNSDGESDVLDIIMLMGIILGQIDGNDYQYLAGDVNGDGNLDVSDIVVIVGWILS